MVVVSSSDIGIVVVMAVVKGTLVLVLCSSGETGNGENGGDG